MKNSIIIFTDGSSLGNPGPGGWGAIVSDGKIVVELGGREAHTTNNRMELTGAIEALKSIKGKKGDAVIHTDSRYVINGITSWIMEWEKRNWMTKQKKPVENKDLWEILWRLVNERDKKEKISWQHVGGHVGIAGNERVDEIATAYAAEETMALYHGPLSRYAHDIKNIDAKRAKSASRKESKSRSRVKAYSYVSLVNGIFKQHATWGECEKRVKGVSGAKFKKALSKEDEHAIRAAWGGCKIPPAILTQNIL